MESHNSGKLRKLVMRIAVAATFFLLGAAAMMTAVLSAVPRPSEHVSVTVDEDQVSSDEASRELSRNRFGLNAAYSF